MSMGAPWISEDQAATLFMQVILQTLESGAHGPSVVRRIANRKNS